MKYFKSLLFTACALIMLAACNNDDLRDDVDDLKNRVESLEAQVNLLNENMTAIRVLLEGGKTITNLKNENGTYTMTLSNGEIITLTQGTKGEVKYPEISVNDKGEWVVNGSVLTQNGQPVLAVGTPGTNGTTPKFQVTTEGSYWQVSYDDGKTWADVLDEAGHKVSATSGSDKFFADVKVSEDGKYFMVKLKDATEYISIPIVKDVLCEIIAPTEGMNNGVWEIGYGKTVTTKVKVKGENIIATAPAGWTVTVGTPSADTNEAVLTISAPKMAANASARATADNSLDVTIQANTGEFWAVDKIQVKAIEIISSYYDMYSKGGTVVIDGVSFNQATYGTATYINEESESKKITAAGVYFIKAGVDVTYEAGDIADNLILIGDTPSEKSKCTLTKGFVTADAAEKELIVMNMKLDGSAYAYSIHTLKGKLKNIIFNNNMFFINEAKNLITCTVAAGDVTDKIVLTNNLIKFKAEKDWSAARVINFDKGLHSTSVVVDNNVIYSSNISYTINGAIVVAYSKVNSSDQAAIGYPITSNITISNNTLINIFPSSQSLVRGVVSGNITYSNLLLFYNTDTARNTTLLNVEGSTNIGTLNFSDIIYYNRGTAIINLNYFAGIVPSGQDNTKVKVEPVDPFDGGTMDFDKGIFIPNASYASHGASIK